MNELERMAIYPKREKAYELELKRLEKDEISARNKELIHEFLNHLFSKGAGILRAQKLSYQLRTLASILDKDFDEITKKDAVAAVAYINKELKAKPGRKAANQVEVPEARDASEATRADYRRTLKQFYNWFRDEDERLDHGEFEIRNKANKLYRYLEKEVSTAYKRKEHNPESIIKDSDCQKVIDKGCLTFRDKAFISMLHESGCRIGEFLNIKIGDLIFQTNFIKINVDGKTGKRIIYLIRSVGHLMRYLEVHPFRDNEKSFLWISNAQHNRNERINHRGAVKLIENCFERAGYLKRTYATVTLENGSVMRKMIKKEVLKQCNPHWFRHSRATILSSKMTEAMLCKFMGWAIGSKQVRTYCHPSRKQLENVYLNIHGFKPEQEKDEMPIQCPCGRKNPPNEKYCSKCYRPLHIETIIDDKGKADEEVNKTMNYLIEVMSNPEKMKQFLEFMKKEQER